MELRKEICKDAANSDSDSSDEESEYLGDFDGTQASTQFNSLPTTAGQSSEEEKKGHTPSPSSASFASAFSSASSTTTNMQKPRCVEILK